MTFFQPASFTHKKCFICGRKKERLFIVKLDSIVNAYQNYSIIIKEGSRSCGRHLNENRLIKEEEFKQIPLKNSYISKINISQKMLQNIFKKTQEGAFEKFKYFDTLDEEHCQNITGWCKSAFLRFSAYITSIKETSKRTKFELIAIYRFWLRKGLDQTSLALIKKNSNQQQISRYLQQIRTAINKDFVPFYLGAKSRERSFYLKCNNVSTAELYDLNNDDLAIFADATYTRLEKSANNTFQYSCWSQQKLDLLIKPFLICCSDGYIIDCYGPFQASINDAKIFEYILKTDKDLINILLPNKTLCILDRGFRDVILTLENEYKFMTKMPSCKQLINKNETDDEKNELEQLKKKTIRYLH